VRARYDNVEFNQGTGAELIARKWGLSRHDLDSFPARSHARAASSIDAGAFTDHIVPVPLDDGRVFDTDEGLRRGTGDVGHAEAVVRRGRRDPCRQCLTDLRRRGGAAGHHPEKANSSA
jgi:acetyl-CoA acetyltransferase